MGRQVDDEIEAEQDRRRRNRWSDRQLIEFMFDRLHVIEMGAIHQASGCPYCDKRARGVL